MTVSGVLISVHDCFVSSSAKPRGLRGKRVRNLHLGFEQLQLANDARTQNTGTDPMCTQESDKLCANVLHFIEFLRMSFYHVFITEDVSELLHQKSEIKKSL